MKNRFSFLAAAGLLFALGACEKDEVQVTANASPAPTLTANATDAGTLLSSNATKTAVVYSWTPVTFTLSDGSKPVVPVTYTLEFAKTGTNFAVVGTVPAGTNTTRDSVKVSDLNSALVKAGLTPTLPGTVDVRLRASYSGNQADMLSGVSKISAVPYSRDLYFYGASIGPLGSESPLIREQSPAKFEGYVYVPNATNAFKLSNTASASGTVFGNAGGNNTISSSSTTDFTLAGPKMYRVSVDLTAGTLTAVATDWGIVGAATTGDGTGWNQSIPMVYDTKDKVWKLTGVTLPGLGTNSEFKFRANNAWTINLGDFKDKPGTRLVQDGGNLTTSGPGKYDVTLDLRDPDKYTYSLTKQR
ncbi:SusE outer membrane protein [Hymenobacter daecheongensis DSM 21074]|uniref:SusE outer membrane protein n=1 Tax=Hymenobacter daecheongensis DSM 21074 TaxID=1121955 RepID=A0A1M6ERW6_9BACT|nr:SusE domain-containing protein [Hymenobacter daecheongensis]SHI88188.1 SusE outer membrane protein [Hymenobacter daecheongensis DSM 21074]